jgi:hypothetical protein
MAWGFVSYHGHLLTALCILHTCIFIRNNIEYLKGLGKEKLFEISAVELSDIGTILACIYRSPDSELYELLHNLELLIVKISTRKKTRILCGDPNVNF